MCIKQSKHKICSLKVICWLDQTTLTAMIAPLLIEALQADTYLLGRPTQTYRTHTISILHLVHMVSMLTSSQAITVLVSHKANGVLFLYTSSSSSFLSWWYKVQRSAGNTRAYFLRLSFSDTLELGDDPIPPDEFSCSETALGDVGSPVWRVYNVIQYLWCT